jgi:hypothetical protein
MRDIEAILSFLPRFQALDPDKAAIRWPGIRLENGLLILDRGENHPLIGGFIEALYEHSIIRDFDWLAWQSRAARFCRQPKLLNSARLQTCIKLLTLHARREHFVDGHFASMVQAGHVTAVLCRMRQLRHTGSGMQAARA